MKIAHGIVLYGIGLSLCSLSGALMPIAQINGAAAIIFAAVLFVIGIFLVIYFGTRLDRVNYLQGDLP